MGLGRLYFKMIKKEYYKDIPFGLLILNWIVQRVFRINAEVPFSVHYTSKVSGFEFMKIHDSSRLSFAVSGGAYIVANKEGILTIEENVIFAHNICIQTINHGLVNRKTFSSKPITIRKNCWIGNSASILSGVVLKSNTTVAANAAVTKSFGSNSVIAGVPAKIIKTI